MDNIYPPHGRDTLVVTLEAECLEQLGAEVPVLWEKSETKEE